MRLQAWLKRSTARRRRCSGVTSPVDSSSVLLALLGGRPLLDLLDDGRVGERGGITQLAVLGDVAEKPAHDLAAASLRQLGREDDVRGLRDRADLRGHVVTELLELLDRAFLA